ELQAARFSENFFEVLAKEYFASAKGKKKRSGSGELLQGIDAFLRVQFAVVFMIKVAVDASLVAAVGEIKMYAQWNPFVHGSCNQMVHQRSGGDLRRAAQRAMPPCKTSAGTSNLRVESSCSKKSVSAKAVS